MNKEERVAAFRKFLDDAIESADSELVHLWIPPGFDEESTRGVLARVAQFCEDVKRGGRKHG